MIYSVSSRSFVRLRSAVTAAACISSYAPLSHLRHIRLGSPATGADVLKVREFLFVIEKHDRLLMLSSIIAMELFQYNPRRRRGERHSRLQC